MDKTLLMMCGQPCSGKSTVSQKLNAQFGIKPISTDDIRMKLSEEATEILNGNPLLRYVVYFHTLKLAENNIINGQSVIVDGTFSKKVFRLGAYYIASRANVPLYIIECICNNYGLIYERFEKRKRNNHLFKEWAEIESYHRKILDFEHLDREVMPDGRPVPIIRYDSEKDRAEIVYSDGSRTIEEIVGTINSPIVQEKKAVGYLRSA